jgi:ADP-ribosyl-[dinitrogen reductase] hydrolase
VNSETWGGLSPRDQRGAAAMLGLAVGDALGATYEFCSPEDVPDGPLEMVGGGWLSLEPGETTDDAALAQAVLEGYQEGPFDLRLVRDAMLRWRDSRPKDIGIQTGKALNYLSAHPETLSIPEKPAAQGNGAVMRAAAHGVGSPDAHHAVQNAWSEAALTHASWEARASSAIVASLVARLIEGDPPHDALESSWSLVEVRDQSGKKVREILRPLELFEHDPGGWTVYTTRLALLSLLEAAEFRTGLEDVVRLAGDADTNAAVAGALLGARFGPEEIPSGWLLHLQGKEELLRLTCKGDTRE